MSIGDRGRMMGVADCPGCHEELAAPLAAAEKVVRCKSCGTRFRLPTAPVLFNNAAVCLVELEIERRDLEAVEQARLSKQANADACRAEKPPVMSPSAA